MATKVLTRDEVLGVLRKHKPELEKRFGVRTLALVAATIHEQSTVDGSVEVLVTFDAPATVEMFFGAQFYLEDLLEHRVGLVTEKYISEHWKPHYQRQAIYV